MNNKCYCSCVYVYVCMYIHIRTYTYVNIYVRRRERGDTHTFVNIEHICIYIYVEVYPLINTDAMCYMRVPCVYDAGVTGVMRGAWRVLCDIHLWP